MTTKQTVLVFVALPQKCREYRQFPSARVAILKWIRKYVKLMNSYLEKIKPQVSDTWRADELYIKIKGDMKYLFAIMDDETRFWIAQEVAETKYKHDARELFQLGVKATGKKPMTLITDGLPAYHDTYKKRVLDNEERNEDRTR
jgi:transposase-like protein